MASRFSKSVNTNFVAGLLMFFLKENKEIQFATIPHVKNLRYNFLFHVHSLENFKMFNIGTSCKKPPVVAAILTYVFFVLTLLFFKVAKMQRKSTRDENKIRVSYCWTSWTSQRKICNRNESYEGGKNDSNVYWCKGGFFFLVLVIFSPQWIFTELNNEIREIWKEKLNECQI